jgi:phosphoenolpyruvate carboxykinase (ATP)
MKEKDVTVFFGLSGTGKTTLSADPKRKLIGDDEHVWTDDGVFNIEGGCYAKGIGLNPITEPEIYHAVRFGSVAENCDLIPKYNQINFDGTSITENTRVAYPLKYIPNAMEKAVAGHPKNIIFLTNDAFGVMPPVSLLTPGQAQFWFITGYTAKVAGTEMGVKSPQPTFSACFGGPFLVMHPTFYGKQLAEKMQKHNVQVWLLNTGWAGGSYGTGKRMPLKVTRALIDAIHDGSLVSGEFETISGWGLRVPKKVKNVPSFYLNPYNAWQDKKAFVETINKLSGMFQKNFQQKYASKASDELKAAVPGVYTAPVAAKL